MPEIRLDGELALDMQIYIVYFYFIQGDTKIWYTLIIFYYPLKMRINYLRTVKYQFEELW